MTECPNCGHAPHDEERCVDLCDDGELCVCSFPDPANFPDQPDLAAPRGWPLTEEMK